MSGRRKLLAALLTLLALAFAGVMIYRGLCLTRAGTLSQAGEYLAAREWYSRAGDSLSAAECEQRDMERRYLIGRAAMDGGRCTEARRLFSMLGDYRDSGLLVLECDYRLACQYAREGRYRLAFDMLERLGDYSAAGAQIEQTRELLYQDALACTYAFELDAAAELWAQLGDYKDSLSVARRCGAVMASLSDAGVEKLLTPEKKYGDYPPVTMYSCDCGYIIVPEVCDENTRFFLYYPGGWEQMISLDFVADYLLAPPENTMALLLYSNGVRGADAMTRTAVATLERAAAEKGIFVHDLLVCGSSMGAYAAMQGVVCCYEQLDIAVDCAMLLDAGVDWSVAQLLPSDDDWSVMARAGTEFFLFEGQGVGMNYAPIRAMVERGNSATVVVCADDEHEAISHDALGKGILNWALGDRQESFGSDMYSFIALAPDSNYPNE